MSQKISELDTKIDSLHFFLSPPSRYLVEFVLVNGFPQHADNYATDLYESVSQEIEVLGYGLTEARPESSEDVNPISVVYRAERAQNEASKLSSWLEARLKQTVNLRLDPSQAAAPSDTEVLEIWWNIRDEPDILQQQDPNPENPRQEQRNPREQDVGDSNLSASEIQQLLVEHNALRAEVGTNPLIWSEALVRSAQNWAEELRKDCSFKHNPDLGGQGETLFRGTAGQFSASEVVDTWATEKENYDYLKNRCTGDFSCDEYLQMVNQRTRRLGCAKVTCGDQDIWVCNYDYIVTEGERPFTKRVLWVDDQPEAHQKERDDLAERYAIQFVLASTNREAINLLQENTYHLLITDLVRNTREDQSGFDLLDTMASRFPNTPTMTYDDQVSSKEMSSRNLEHHVRNRKELESTVLLLLNLEK